MDFRQHCDLASEILRRFHSLTSASEELVTRLDEDRENVGLLTNLVQKLYEGDCLSEELLQQHLVFIDQEERGVGYAIRLAHDELARRMRGVRHDLEICTIVKKPKRLLHCVG